METQIFSKRKGRTARVCEDNLFGYKLSVRTFKAFMNASDSQIVENRKANF